MLEKITEQQLAENGVVSAPDKLEGDSKDNKAVFDRLVTQLVAGVVNQIIEAHNALDVDVNGRIDAVLDELRNHVDVDPGNITAQNVGLLRELADKYGLTDKVAPTVHDALEVLECWAKLQPETAERLRLPEGTVVLDEAIKVLAQTELSSLTGGLKITAVYKTSGRYAENVYFRGLPDAAENLLKTDKYGEFFAELPVGEYILTFRPIIGEKPIPECVVTVSAKEISEIRLELEPSSELKAITESNEYLVGEDATKHNVMVLGGGGSGGAVRCHSNMTDSDIAAAAAAGGGSGHIETLEVDFTGLRRQMVTVVVGAGALGVTATGATEAVTGNTGGTTSVATKEGTVLISAVGGSGGSALAVPEYASKTIYGGEGATDGASVYAVAAGSLTDISFTDEHVDGVFVFGKEDYPLVAGGGFAVVDHNYDAPTKSRFGAGCNEDGTTIDGLGAGSGGAAEGMREVGKVSSAAGGSGAVFIE